MVTTSHILDPCDKCSKKRWCEVPARLSRIQHPWNVPDVEFGRPFMETVRAEIRNEGLHVVLRCQRFEEMKDAEKPDRR